MMCMYIHCTPLSLILPLTLIVSHDNLAPIMCQTCQKWVGMGVINFKLEKAKCQKNVMSVRLSGSMQPRVLGSLGERTARMYSCTSPPSKWKVPSAWRRIRKLSFQSSKDPRDSRRPTSYPSSSCIISAEAGSRRGPGFYFPNKIEKPPDLFISPN